MVFLGWCYCFLRIARGRKKFLALSQSQTFFNQIVPNSALRLGKLLEYGRSAVT